MHFKFMFVFWGEGPAHLTKLALKAPRLSKPALMFSKSHLFFTTRIQTPKCDSRAGEALIFRNMRSIKYEWFEKICQYLQFDQHV